LKYCYGESTDTRPIGRSIIAPTAPNRETPPASRSAGASDPVASAIAPAALGPAACPIPKKSVTNPSPADANRGPRRSPQAAAITAGMDQAERPKRIAEMINPVGSGQRAKRLKETACIR